MKAEQDSDMSMSPVTEGSPPAEEQAGMQSMDDSDPESGDQPQWYQDWCKESYGGNSSSGSSDEPLPMQCAGCDESFVLGGGYCRVCRENGTEAEGITLTQVSSGEESDSCEQGDSKVVTAPMVKSCSGDEHQKECSECIMCAEKEVEQEFPQCGMCDVCAALSVQEMTPDKAAAVSPRLAVCCSSKGWSRGRPLGTDGWKA